MNCVSQAIFGESFALLKATRELSFSKSSYFKHFNHKTEKTIKIIELLGFHFETQLYHMLSF